MLLNIFPHCLMLTVSFLKVESFAANVSACAFSASRRKTMANNWANIILVLQKHELTSRTWAQSDLNGFTEKMFPYLDLGFPVNFVFSRNFAFFSSERNTKFSRNNFPLLLETLESAQSIWLWKYTFWLRIFTFYLRATKMYLQLYEFVYFFLCCRVKCSD